MRVYQFHHIRVVVSGAPLGLPGWFGIACETADEAMDRREGLRGLRSAPELYPSARQRTAQ